MARVHAVTIHHRGRDMLDVCLRSLLASGGVDLEIVVVLNGCDEALPEIAETSSKVHVVATEAPVGFSEANNVGTEWAAANLGDADFYYFVNNDTRSETDALATLVAAVAAVDRAAAAGPTLIIDWAPEYLNSLGLNVTDDAWAWDEGIGIGLDEYGPLPERRPVIALTGSALLVACDAYRGVGGWTELYDFYFEDIDLCLKLRDAGWEVVHEPAAVVGHHVSATMTIESEYKYYLFWRNRLVLALVHWPVGLLARLFRVAVVDEVLRRPRTDNALQRRALRGALAKLPGALAARTRTGGRRDWTAMLVPRGSVPVITLPEKPRPDAGGDDEAAVPDGAWRSAERLTTPSDGGRRVLVLGCSPLPFENQRMNYAPGARTWQLARPLADAGHAVCVVAQRIPGAYGGEVDRIDGLERDGIPIYTLDLDDFRRPGVVDGLVDAFRPDVLIGAASTVPALRAIEVAGDRPVWIDLFGDLMAEAQARLTVHPDEPLAPYRDVLAALLERGDAFSAVSDRQRDAVLGQLGLLGRLNRRTSDCELVHTVPCSVRFDVASTTSDVRAPVPDDVEDDDVVLLWSGGFNTWCDADTLVDGVERAMASEPRIQLVTTGGSIPGHDDVSYQRFLDRVRSSELRDRFVVKGPVDAGLAARYLARADLGVVTEKPLAERRLGSSGRVVGWVSAGLPAICTTTSEIGERLAERGLVRAYRAGDPDDLARAIIDDVRDLDGARERARRAREFARGVWSVQATAAPVVRWVERARRAPDATADNPLALTPMLGAARRLGEVRRELDDARAAYHTVRGELGTIHTSRMWKTWMSYHRLVSWFRPGSRRRRG